MDVIGKKRIDYLVANKYKINREIAKLLIEQNLVTYNNKLVKKPNYLVSENELNLLDAKLDKLVISNQDEAELSWWNKQLNIVYEDEYLLVINKESGVLALPDNYEQDKTILNAVLNYLKVRKIKFKSNEMFQFLVHRLDKDTSGLLLIAKNFDSHKKLLELFKKRKVVKKYFCLLSGFLKTKKVRIEAALKRIKNTNKFYISQDSDAKNAISIFTEIERFSNFTLAEANIKTGRTHQIRVHAKYINNQIINDPVYSLVFDNKNRSYGQYLHAYYLSFTHPYTNKKLILKLDLPLEFKRFIKLNS